MVGEVLRGMKNPSVTELLIRRSDDSAKRAKHEDSPDPDWQSVCKLTFCLARWDPKAAVPAIQRRLTDLRLPDREARPRDDELQYLTPLVANMIDAGLGAGDDEVINQDYVAWLRAAWPSEMGYFEPLIFLPLWRHPDNPMMAEFARWLFLAEDSRWRSRLELSPFTMKEAITSPLVGVSPFRELLKREFVNTTRIGDFQISGNSVSFSTEQGSSGVISYYTPDVKVPKSDAKRPLRACDFCAAEISQFEGSPRYEMYWPEKRRDAVRKDIAKFLDQRGNCFRDRSKSFVPNYDVFSTARFRLPRLSQPATAEDVAAGRAIFSLRDRPNAQVRVVPLKPYPTIARWKTLQQFPLLETDLVDWPSEKDVKDKKVLDKLPEERFDREGLIWQAEEVLQDGRWRRYYGFVGNHIIAKVPAEESELLERFGPAHPFRP